MTGHPGGNDVTRTGRCAKRNGREVGRAPACFGFHQNVVLGTELTEKMCLKSLCAFFSQPRRAGLDDVAIHLRHARGWRSLARRIWKNMQKGQPARIDYGERVFKHLIRFGGKPGDQVSAEHNVRAHLADALAELNTIAAVMAPLHALQGHIIPRLQGEVKMRHQPLLSPDHVKQLRVRFDGVD